MENTDQLLKMIYASPTIDGDIALWENMLKKKKVQELVNSGVHKRAITRLKNGGMQTYVTDPDTGKRKAIQGRSEEAFYNSLYEFYFGSRSRIRMCDLYDEWKQTQMEYNLSPRTIRRYDNSYETYLKGTVIDTTPMCRISSRQCSDFFNKMISKYNLTLKQYCNIVVIPNKMFQYAIEKEIIRESPMDKVQINTRACRNKTNLKTSDRIYFADEKKAFLSELQHQINKEEIVDYYAIALIWKLGLRIGELVALKWSDIDEQAMEIHIQRMESRDINNKPCIVEHCKGNSPYADRRLPLSDYEMRLFDRVRDYNRDHDYSSEYIFNGYNYKTCRNERRTIKNIYSSIRRICRNAGIPVKSAHDIRRTVASDLFANGETLESIRDLLGHSDIRTTSEYIVDTRAIEERGKRRQRILGANDLILSNEPSDVPMDESKIISISVSHCKSNRMTANP